MLLLNKTLLGLARGLWGWIFLITALKLLTLVGTAAAAGQAVISALLTALLLLGRRSSPARRSAAAPLRPGFPCGGAVPGVPGAIAGDGHGYASARDRIHRGEGKGDHPPFGRQVGVGRRERYTKNGLWEAVRFTL